MICIKVKYKVYTVLGTLKFQSESLWIMCIEMQLACTDTLTLVSLEKHLAITTENLTDYFPYFTHFYKKKLKLKEIVYFSK